MSTEQTASTPNSASQSAGTERCVCQEVLDHVARMFEVSPAVKQHLMNSRVEFLKAIRAVIDQRIEHLSGTGQQHGSRIAVE
ncbi:MAG: hypothetical protein WA581_18015 [Candidatus Acidiferrales bacterium]